MFDIPFFWILIFWLNQTVRFFAGHLLPFWDYHRRPSRCQVFAGSEGRAPLPALVTWLGNAPVMDRSMGTSFKANGGNFRCHVWLQTGRRITFTFLLYNIIYTHWYSMFPLWLCLIPPFNPYPILSPLYPQSWAKIRHYRELRSRDLLETCKN